MGWAPVSDLQPGGSGGDSLPWRLASEVGLSPRPVSPGSAPGGAGRVGRMSHGMSKEACGGPGHRTQRRRVVACRTPGPPQELPLQTGGRMLRSPRSRPARAAEPAPWPPHTPGAPAPSHAQGSRCPRRVTASQVSLWSVHPDVPRRTLQWSPQLGHAGLRRSTAVRLKGHGSGGVRPGLHEPAGDPSLNPRGPGPGPGITAVWGGWSPWTLAVHDTSCHQAPFTGRRKMVTC